MDDVIVTPELASASTALAECGARLQAEWRRIDALLGDGCTRETYIGASLEFDQLCEEHRVLRRRFEEELDVARKMRRK